MSNETTLEPVYFAECRKALAAYYTEHHAKGASFLIKNIPGKLYNAGLLYNETPHNRAIEVCLHYADRRDYFIEHGASPDKAGDMALDEMINPADPDDLTDKLLKEAETMTEQAQQDNANKIDPVAANAQYRLNVFPQKDGAIYHVRTGIALATGLEIISNSPDAMYYIPQFVEHLMDNIMELVNSGHYAINYAVLAKEFRDSLESQGLPPKQANELDDYFGEHPAKQGNATPKGNNQTQPTRPAQTQQAQQASPTPNAYTAEIVAVELVKSSKGTEGFKWFKTHNNERKNIGFGEYRSNVSEAVLAALGFTVDDIASMNVGDVKQAKNKGVKAEYILEEQSDGKKWTKVTGYIKPDGSRI